MEWSAQMVASFEAGPTWRSVVSATSRAASWLSGLPERPVRAKFRLDQLTRALDFPLQRAPRAPDRVVDELAAAAEPGLVGSASGRFFAGVVGGTLPAALGADILTSAWDQNAGAFAGAPSAAVAEMAAGKWVISLLGLPQASSIGFVTGGSMANFTCLAAARHEVLRRAGWLVEREGLRDSPRVRVIVSSQRHVSVDSALRYLGFGDRQTRFVDVDPDGRMIVNRLREALEEEPDVPAIVCLAAGHVHTGAFDPFTELIPLAHDYHAWVHIDGAFGLWAAAAPNRRKLVVGVDEADSWAVDAHKWLNVPHDCGMAIVRDNAAHRAAMGTSLPLLWSDEQAAFDPFDFCPELSRRARAFPVWAALRSLGTEGLGDLIEHCCAMAKHLREGLRTLSGAVIMDSGDLNQVLVRFSDDATTEAVVRHVNASGTAFVSAAQWRGVSVLRATVTNWCTTSVDIERTLNAISIALDQSAVQLRN